MPESYSLELSNGKTHLYEVMPSKRAKHIRIKLSNTGKLSVVLPYRSSAKHAHQFIQSKSAWIEKHLATLPEIKAIKIPNNLELRLLGERWTIRKEIMQNALPTLETDNEDKILYFSGGDQQLDSFHFLLSRWLINESKAIFSEMLEELAEQHGFHYNRLSIRAQKTRWGSCSSRKNISLNCKLLFMPKSVVKYVMIHELCHTVQMNHSHKFWSLVEDCDPDFQAHRKTLKQFNIF